MTAVTIEEPFGPAYPKTIPGTEKYRRNARAGMCNAGEYGEAVLAGIRKMQAQALARETTIPSSSSASGTYLSDGEAILKAVRGQQAAEMHRQDVHNDKVAREKYEARMEAQREARAAALKKPYKAVEVTAPITIGDLQGTVAVLEMDNEELEAQLSEALADVERLKAELVKALTKPAKITRKSS